MHTSKLVLVVPVLSDQSTYHSVSHFFHVEVSTRLPSWHQQNPGDHKDTIRQHAEHWVRVSDHVYGAVSP